MERRNASNVDQCGFNSCQGFQCGCFSNGREPVFQTGISEFDPRHPFQLRCRGEKSFGFQVPTELYNLYAISGVLTVPAAAVPEPGSMALMAFGAGLLTYRRVHAVRR